MNSSALLCKLEFLSKLEGFSGELKEILKCFIVVYLSFILIICIQNACHSLGKNLFITFFFVFIFINFIIVLNFFCETLSFFVEFSMCVGVWVVFFLIKVSV